MPVIGRINEIAILEEVYKSNKAEFLALYGRRRIGKTYLIREFFSRKKVTFFDVSGTKNEVMSVQIKHFMGRLQEVFFSGLKLAVAENWDEAFNTLTNAIKSITSKSGIVLFFDELPWMATRNSKLLEAIDYYWNQYWSKDKRIKLIICGSSASWIIKKIIKNKGGLHNRITQKIYLAPFNLFETKKFLQAKQLKLSDTQILQLYMILGGVPYYLAKIPRHSSVAQIIKKLAFSAKSFLLEEFDNLFASLFDENDGMYIKAIELIAGAREGIGKRELLKKLGKSMVGSTGLKILQELEDTGFIKSFKPSYHQRQGIYYRLVDEYVSFYLRWIKPIKMTLQESALEQETFEAMQLTPKWQSWLGYAFESVCYKHLIQIRKALKLNALAVANSWRYIPKKKTSDSGAQIDLLFDRTDDAITLCEIKYSHKSYIIRKEFLDDMRKKIQIFKEKTGTRKQILAALITANGVAKSTYTDDFFSGVVTLNDLYHDTN